MTDAKPLAYEPLTPAELGEMTARGIGGGGLSSYWANRLLTTLHAERQQRETAKRDLASARAERDEMAARAYDEHGQWWDDECERARKERDEARRRARWLEAVLNRIRWRYGPNGAPASCVYCGTTRGSAHEPDCQIDAALSPHPGDSP